MALKAIKRCVLMRDRYEMSAQMCATSLMGFGAHRSSHSFFGCFPYPAITRWRQAYRDAGSRVDTAPANQGRETAAEQYCDLGEKHDAAEQSKREAVSGALYRLPGGRVVVIPQNVHYGLRGDSRGPLALMSLYEYAALIDVVKCDGGPTTESQRKIYTEDYSTRFGRAANSTFDFHPYHPLHGEYVQKLRSKFRIPLINAPSYPMVKDESKRGDWAAYHAVTLRPWNYLDQAPDLSWGAFTK